MKIAFIGCVHSSFHSLQKLLKMKSLGIEVVGVVTKAKSKLNADFKDLSPLCAEYHIPVHFEDNKDKAEPLAPLRQIKIIPFKEKNEWELCPKYNIGNK